MMIPTRNGYSLNTKGLLMFVLAATFLPATMGRRFAIEASSASCGLRGSRIELCDKTKRHRKLMPMAKSSSSSSSSSSEGQTSDEDQHDYSDYEHEDILGHLTQNVRRTLTLAAYVAGAAAVISIIGVLFWKGRETETEEGVNSENLLANESKKPCMAAATAARISAIQASGISVASSVPAIIITSSQRSVEDMSWMNSSFDGDAPMVVQGIAVEDDIDSTDGRFA